MRRLLDVLREDLGADRHQGGLRGRGVRRLHGPARRLAGRLVPRAGLPGGGLRRSSRSRGWPRHPRNPAGPMPTRRAPGGLPRDGRRPVRHLHARHADGRRAPTSTRAAVRTTTPSARRSPATCAAARATRRSSRRSPSRPSRTTQEARADEPGHRSHPRPDQRQAAASVPEPDAAGADRRDALDRCRPWRRSRPPSWRSASASWPRSRPGRRGPASAESRRTARPVRPALTVCPSSRPSPARRPRGRLRAAGRGPITPIAGGTDLMVALTGELGEPPERMLDLWHLDELRGIALDGDAVVLGALTTYTEIRRLGALPRAPAGPGRGGRHDRCGPDPEPRHDRRQCRQRLAGGRYAADPARARCDAWSAVRAAASARCPRPRFWPAYRRTALAPDELLLRIRVPAGRWSRDCASARSGRGAPSRSARS